MKADERAQESQLMRFWKLFWRRIWGRPCRTQFARAGETSFRPAFIGALPIMLTRLRRSRLGESMRIKAAPSIWLVGVMTLQFMLPLAVFLR